MMATLGQPHRSFSPEERQTRGGGDQGRVPEIGWDDGEWTEVKQRRRKERRQAERVFEDERQRRRNRSRSTSIPKRQFFNEKHNRNQSLAFDHAHTGRSVYDRHRSRSHTGWVRSHRWSEALRHGESRAVVQQYEASRLQSFSPLRNHGHHSPSRLHGNRLLNFNNRSVRDGQVFGNRQNNYNNRDGKDTDFESKGVGKEINEGECNFSLGTKLKRYVSFYFTNFPAQLSHFYLRKGFEVCGILEDVYVAKKRNIYGEPYGFVKFSNVCDVNKLSKALNVVYFGHFRVRARVARFDRNDVKESRSAGMVDASAQMNAQEQAEGLIFRKPTNVTDVPKENEGIISLRKFRTTPDDVKWAQNGLVATIINGEAVPVVQNRITDAGFNDLILVPMGAGKVFVRSSAGVDARAIVNGAKDFFTLLFLNWERWGNEGFPYQRGAWVRLYGIPIHAWNVNFFKMCVFDCGRFLRADSCSADWDKLDFARVLIATPDLEIIKRVESVLVDGTLTKIKIVEEWGYALGEDTCLFEEESDSEVSQNDNEVEHDDPEVASPTGKDGIVDEEVQITHMTDFSNDSPQARGDRDVRTSCSPGVTTDQVNSLICNPTEGVRKIEEEGRRDGSSLNYPRSKRTKSCPPIENRPVLSGPWSLEWLHDLNQGDAGGDDQVADDDIQGIGKALGVTYKGDRENRFRVLSRPSNKKHVMIGQEQGARERRRNHSFVVSVVWGRRVCVMKIISWNVRGLGGIEKRKEVCRLVVDQNPFFLCLQESKLQTCDVFLCSTLWGNSPHDFSYHPSVGASGGLLSIWDSNEVEVWSTKSREHVLWCHGRFIKSGEDFSVANVYAPCDDGAKQGLWDSLSASIQMLGGRGYLPLSGRKFTWFKGDEVSMSRLDRFLLSEEWCLTWPNCKLDARMRGLSDHCPLILSANEEDWGPRPSRMLKCWKDIPGYYLFVREKWKSLQVDGWGGFVLKEKLKMIKAALKDWHSAHTQNLPSRIDSLKNHLSILDQKGEEETLTEVELVELHGVTADIHSLSRLHASVCWQQSRSLWLKEGDANSKYFHSIMARRRRGNVISSIKVDGVTLEGVSPIRETVVSHFASHFKATLLDRPVVDNLLFKTLNPLECSSLIKPFSVEEVKAAVWDCDSYKSPGPDGINFGFIKDFWADLQGDVMRFISEFHRNGKLTKGLNSTFIALVPMVDNPQCLNDFRPISLVGSIYMILAKVLANRLRSVIGSVISESQTAFVKDRQIPDGILIANEVVDEARMSKKELMLFKVDFEKAYDSVDWGYLDAVMGRMYFPTLWRKWIRECVCTATSSILVNGSPTEEFPLERGLRQGDPLSPFLFLLAAEGLSVLMKTMVERNLFTGYSIGKREPISISHLQFADDTLLLGVKSWENVRALRAFLVLFESMSGLKVNFNKSMGLERGRLCAGGASGSPWWRAIERIRDGGGEIGGGWFGENITKKVGDGSDTFFWTNSWVDETPLCERFGRLFDLAENNSTSVAEMFSLGWGAGGEAWVWRQPLRAWEEEMLEECQTLLLTVSLQDHFSDRWEWRPDLDSGYTVRGAYQLLTDQDVAPLDVAAGLIWHSQVPLKVSILAWRLLRDRLPTKANLITRGCLSSVVHHCVSGCGEVESAQHLFLSCNTFGSLWSLVSSWIGSSMVTAQILPDHFVQFTCSAGGSRARHSFMQLIWLACVWVVWTERNHRLFRGSANSLLHMLDKIKTFSYRWLKVKSSTLALNCHSWWYSPMLCLGFV
ncbi:hypothetical protein TSUD_102790 [Trifolium subterraneum]|uniref:Reverse transcriptase domain-containing protein n=1 Tax=Trifolium subterraneum TaxID=3900 RepID=A0A2Z6NMG8_TRISU|nr:hypothetical protein TSUD_102790 [Trifolium subterraneum]